MILWILTVIVNYLYQILNQNYIQLISEQMYNYATIHFLMIIIRNGDSFHPFDA